MFSGLCFAVTGTWLWSEILTDNYGDSLGPINNVLLCTISAIIGLVLAAFTGWHLSLVWKGQTTIECLEKTRYLSPLRKSMQKRQFGTPGGEQSYGQQLAEIHANALPGVTRAEEGEERIPNEDVEHGFIEQGFSARASLHQNYDQIEQARERERYEEYLDEQDSEKLPNAFDLGWRRNLRHLFGDRFWFLPICNTTGDGWRWEPSSKWIESRDRLRLQQESRWRGQGQRQSRPGTRLHPESDHDDHDERRYLTTSNGVAIVPGAGSRSPGKANQVLGRSADGYFDVDFSSERPSSRMSMQTLRRRESFGEERDASFSDRSLSVDGGEREVAREDDGWREWD